MEYRSIPTTLGRAKLEQAALMQVPLQLTVVEFGDGGGAEYAPTGLETALRGKVYAAAPNMIFKSEEAETWVELQAVIPFDVGGWWLREYGVRDAAGDLIFIGNLPQSFKPQGSSGAIKDVAFELLFDIQNADSVTLKVDPAKVLATRKYVDDAVAAAATEATQAEAEAGADGTRKMTPRRVWQAITKRLSTQIQAEGGTDNETAMTPLGVSQAIAKKVIQATETVLGIAKIATQAQTDAGTNDSAIVTPKKLRMGFAVSLAGNGYIAFPTWMGGLIVQWGSVHAAAGTPSVFLETPFSWPIAFPTAIYAVSSSLTSGNYNADFVNLSLEGRTLTGATFIYAGAVSQPSRYSFIAIGK